MKGGPKPICFSPKKIQKFYTEIANGTGVVALAAKYNTSPLIIRRNIVRLYGEEEYHRIVHAWKKGRTAWNKGKKGFAPWMKQYQYQVGHLRGTAARKWRPIGTIVIWNKGGKKLRYIKLRDKRRSGSTNWIQYCHYVWQEANGPIPEGKDIVHLDTNLLNDDIDNLAAMTRSDFRKYLCKKYPKRFGIGNLIRKRRGAGKLKSAFYRARVAYVPARILIECVNCSASVPKGTKQCPKRGSYAILEEKIKRAKVG